MSVLPHFLDNFQMRIVFSIGGTVGLTERIIDCTHVLFPLRFRCLKCGHKTISASNMNLHLLSKHPHQFATGCAYCSFTCLKPQTLKKHMVEKHPEMVLAVFKNLKKTRRLHKSEQKIFHAITKNNKETTAATALNKAISIANEIDTIPSVSITKNNKKPIATSVSVVKLSSKPTSNVIDSENISNEKRKPTTINEGLAKLHDNFFKAKDNILKVNNAMDEKRSPTSDPLEKDNVSEENKNPSKANVALVKTLDNILKVNGCTLKANEIVGPKALPVNGQKIIYVTSPVTVANSIFNGTGTAPVKPIKVVLKRQSAVKESPKIIRSILKPKMTIYPYQYKGFGYQRLPDTTPTINLDNSFNAATNTYECKECKINFNSASSLQIHDNITHKKQLRYQCMKCGFKCCQNFQMRDHIDEEHVQSQSNIVPNVTGKELYEKAIKAREIEQMKYKTKKNLTVLKPLKEKNNSYYVLRLEEKDFKDKPIEVIDLESSEKSGENENITLNEKFATSDDTAPQFDMEVDSIQENWNLIQTSVCTSNITATNAEVGNNVDEVISNEKTDKPACNREISELQVLPPVSPQQAVDQANEVTKRQDKFEATIDDKESRMAEKILNTSNRVSLEPEKEFVNQVDMILPDDGIPESQSDKPNAEPQELDPLGQIDTKDFTPDLVVKASNIESMTLDNHNRAANCKQEETDILSS